MSTPSLSNMFGVLADKDVQVQRVTCCLACEHVRIGLTTRCALCGCVIKAKAAVAASGCPADKWPS